jgi:hypothetical protein
MLEPTLEFREKYRRIPYKAEMQSHIAWTQSTTLYYKLGKLPWKLRSVREGVCYLGLVFKKYKHFKWEGYACSAAQMFLDSGDGTVFKGNIGPWKNPNYNEFHIDEASAEDLLGKALDTYQRKMSVYPKEIFIHSSFYFSDEEWRGFLKAVNKRNAPTTLTGIRIVKSDKLKLYRDRFRVSSTYGNLRGLAWPLDNREGYLWTTGFVPRLGTSISLEIPSPLRINIIRGEADIEQVMRDVLALTKLNYNACEYGDGLPVTLRFSDVIGNILTAVDKIDAEVLPFKFYI